MPGPERIVSLVPHATELLFALGLEGRIVGVTHECDYPAAAAGLAKVTRDVLPAGLSAREIDTAVRERTLAGDAIYELDVDALEDLAPDLIVTQALCPVCAVSYEDVRKVAKRLPSQPRVIALDPHTLGETLGDVRTLAEATGTRERGVELVRRTAARIDRVRLAVRGAGERPRVAALEWLDPLFVAGHWTPQLIELAGGEDVLGLPGEPSREISWEELEGTRPEIALAIPCGYGADRARAEAEPFAERLHAAGAARVVAVDASSYFSRPGPRLVDGLELLAHVLHPDLAPEPASGAVALEVQPAPVRR